MSEIVNFYVSLLPVILAGIANAAFTQSKVLRLLDRPIDGGKKFSDKKRILGDSKTYKGFLGYVVLGIIFTVLWGFICSTSPALTSHNFFYQTHDNTLLFNIMIGCLLGFAWAICELPNSFLKRRVNIKSSHGAKGVKGVLFAILDQADSIFGIVLVVALFYPLSVSWYFLFVALGAATHIIFNFLLYIVKLRTRPL
jgi:CDP-diglyceride synthetase